MAWYLASDYTPSGGPVAASANPGSIGHGYVDVSGNVWSIDSSNVMHAVTNATSSFNAGLLLNTSSVAQTVDSQVITRFTFVAGEAVSFVSRASSTSGNTTGYLAILDSVSNAVKFFSCVSGTASTLYTGSNPASTLTAGTQYDLTFTTTQTNSTTTQLTLTVADTSGNVINTGTFSDTTASLQNRSAGIGLFIAAQSSGNSPGSVNRVQIYGDVNNSPTSYNVYLPASANQNQAVSGTVSPIGGANMTSSLSVTLSDGAGGTFSPNPVVVTSGTPSANFTYTPISSGNLTVSYTHTGGNSGMTGDGSATVAVTGTKVFYLNKDYIPSGGPVAASPSPGSIGNGYVDYGGVWSIDSSNVLHQAINTTSSFNASLILRTASSEQAVDSQIIMRFTFVSLEGTALLSRASNTGGNTTGYLVIVPPDTNAINIYAVNAGSATQVYSGSTPGTKLVAGSQYDITLQTTQTNSTTTKLVVSVVDTSGNVITSATYNDTTSALQNLVGSPGVTFPGYPSASLPGSVNRIRTYGDVNNSPTSYYTYIPSSVLLGQTISGTIYPISGANMTSSLSVLLSDGSGGTFSPNPVIISSGTPSANFTYTPASSGSKTVSYTHTGGNSGMTGDGSATVAVYSTTATIGTNHPSCVLSPHNWSVGSGGAGTSQTINAGAYARYYVQGCVSAVILTDTTQTNVYFSYAIDNGPLTFVKSPSSGQTSVTFPDTGSHVLKINFSAWDPSVQFNPGVWSRTLYFGLVGVQLTTQLGGGTAPATRHSRNVIWYGDSISMGYRANNGSNGIEYCQSYYVCQSLFELGYEYSIVATGSLGYTITGAGGVPPVYTPGNDAQSSWNKIDQITYRVVNGFITPPPDVIIDNHGTNDAANNVSGPALQGPIIAFYNNLKSAAPNAIIIKVIPYGGQARADILAALSAYQAAMNNPLQTTVDLGIDSRMSSGSYSQYPVDLIHPLLWGHANIGSLLDSFVVNRIAQANTNRAISLEFTQMPRVNI